MKTSVQTVNNLVLLIYRAGQENQCLNWISTNLQGRFRKVVLKLNIN